MSNSNVNASLIGASNIASTAPNYAKKLQVAAYPARLFNWRTYSKSDTTLYIQVHNSVTEPTDMSTIACAPYKHVAHNHGGQEYNGGIPLSTGIWIMVSTSETALVAPETSDVFIDAGYRRIY